MEEFDWMESDLLYSTNCEVEYSDEELEEMQEAFASNVELYSEWD